MPESEEIDFMLRPLAAGLSNEADAILDLRDLLINHGHPGKCVKCFFQLFGAADAGLQPKLSALKSWLEENVQISVRRGNRELEVFPLVLLQDTLETFCLRAMETIRLDRGYPGDLRMSFRYKNAA